MHAHTVNALQEKKKPQIYYIYADLDIINKQYLHLPSCVGEPYSFPYSAVLLPDFSLTLKKDTTHKHNLHPLDSCRATN